MLSKLMSPLKKFAAIFKRYVVMLCIVIFGAMCAYLVYTGGQLAKRSPSEAEINDKYQGSSRPKIDPAIAQKLSELQAENIEIKTLFENARSNPFSE
jgi:hypothetical protein